MSVVFPTKSFIDIINFARKVDDNIYISYIDGCVIAFATNGQVLVYNKTSTYCKCNYFKNEHIYVFKINKDIVKTAQLLKKKNKLDDTVVCLNIFNDKMIVEFMLDTVKINSFVCEQSVCEITYEALEQLIVNTCNDDFVNIFYFNPVKFKKIIKDLTNKITDCLQQNVRNINIKTVYFEVVNCKEMNIYIFNEDSNERINYKLNIDGNNFNLKSTQLLKFATNIDYLNNAIKCLTSDNKAFVKLQFNNSNKPIVLTQDNIYNINIIINVTRVPSVPVFEERLCKEYKEILDNFRKKYKIPDDVLIYDMIKRSDGTYDFYFCNDFSIKTPKDDKITINCSNEYNYIVADSECNIQSCYVTGSLKEYDGKILTLKNQKVFFDKNLSIKCYRA